MNSKEHLEKKNTQRWICIPAKPHFSKGGCLHLPFSDHKQRAGAKKGSCTCGTRPDSSLGIGRGEVCGEEPLAREQVERWKPFVH